MVEVGTGSAKEKYVKTRYPVEKGNTAGTTSQEGRVMTLEAQDYSNVRESKKVGMQNY